MKGYFIYMFLDDNENPLYIGQSINLIQRIEKQHFLSEYGNLSEECIQITKQILYHECVSADDMKIKERYLINTLSPRFNISLNNNSRFSFTIDNIEWKYLSLNTELILEKKEENKIKKKTLRDIPAVLLNAGTKTNCFFKAKISKEFKNDYLKFKTSKGYHAVNFIFKINGNIYLYLFSDYWHLLNEQPAKGYTKRFNNEEKNIFGLHKNDYLDVEIEHFQDNDFVSNFCDFEERKEAEYIGHPIICRDKELSELYSSFGGCYYEYRLTLIRYEALKKLSLLHENTIEKVEKLLSLSIGEEGQRGNVRTTLRSAKSDEYTERF